jgi:hypothetical protein
MMDDYITSEEIETRHTGTGTRAARGHDPLRDHPGHQRARAGTVCADKVGLHDETA